MENDDHKTQFSKTKRLHFSGSLYCLVTQPKIYYVFLVCKINRFLGVVVIFMVKCKDFLLENDIAFQLPMLEPCIWL